MSAPDTRRHFAFLRETGDLAALLAGSTDVEQFLDRVVRRVAEHLGAAVCSVYLYEDAPRELVLRATVGLRTEAVNQVRLALGEGLVGLALRELRTIYDAQASRNPGFKPVPGVGEEPFDVLLAVPIRRGIEKIGVLVVQREAGRPFDPEAIGALEVLTSQLAGALENARALLQLAAPAAPARSAAGAPDTQAGRRAGPLRGQVAAPGCAAGPAAILRRGQEIQLLRDADPSAFCANGLSAPGRRDLDAAVAVSAAQLESLQEQAVARLPEAAALIFDAQLLMLKDHGFMGGIREGIAAGRAPAQSVVEVANRYIARLNQSTHAYLREKARDVEDLAARLLGNLRGDEHGAPVHEGRIVIAAELLPSQVMRLAIENARGVVLAGGGLTSHVAILARSLRLPMVLVDDAGVLETPEGVWTIVDGETGNVYLDPPAPVRERFNQREAAQRAAADRAAAVCDLTLTRDGTRVRLAANINLLSEMEAALHLKAEGVGLYRTEFPFLIRDALPGEADEVAIYARLMERMAGLPVTVRTLDAGGDKMLAYFDEGGEPNPELGLRSTRFTLRHPEILRQQVRAILRAAARTDAQVRIMFPMIGSLDEFRRARGLVGDALRELGAAAPRVAPPVGMMIELPAVVELLEDFAREAAFFSVGTNDFVQYMLAADRANERVREYYCPYHPAVLRALRRLVETVTAAGRDLSVCGEMAHDPRLVPFLVGIGVRALSLDPVFLPGVQATIQSMTLDECRAYADSLLACATIEGVATRLRGGGPVTTA